MTFFSPSDSPDAELRNVTLARSSLCQRPSEPIADVGEFRRGRIGADELERHVASCGYLMLLAFARYEETSDFGDLGEAHRWRLLMEDAIKSRSAATVARMERERGLA